MEMANPPALMTVRVLLFAQLRGGFGAEALTMELPSGTTGADLMHGLSQQRPELQGLLAVSRLAIGCEYVSPDRVLQAREDVAVIPPVSGG